MNRLVFLGTGCFACGCLDGLKQAGMPVDLIVTKPDRPQGRGRKLAIPPVKQWALDNRVPCVQPLRINSGHGKEMLMRAKPDLLVVVEYGSILKPDVLAIPRLGAVNVHASLLPQLRGAAPIEWAILRGLNRTGVTTIFMDQGMDSGDIIHQRAVDIEPEENSGQLRRKLTVLAGQLLPETVTQVFAETAPRTPQPETGVSFAPRLTSDMEKICWHRGSRDIVNQIRAFAPRPGAYCMFRGRRVKILSAREISGCLSPAVLTVDGRRLLAGSGSGTIEILEIQPEGKKPMSGAQFVNGYRVKEGDSFS